MQAVSFLHQPLQAIRATSCQLLDVIMTLGDNFKVSGSPFEVCLLMVWIQTILQMGVSPLRLKEKNVHFPGKVRFYTMPVCKQAKGASLTTHQMIDAENKLL